MLRPTSIFSQTTRNLCLVAAASGALLLSGCNSEPAGQVAASVNGDEITLTELNAELASVQVPENADKKQLQRQALERIVERKLLADAGIDPKRMDAVMRVADLSDIVVEDGAIKDADRQAALKAPRMIFEKPSFGSESYVADWVMDILPSFVSAVDEDIVVETSIDQPLQMMGESALQAGLFTFGQKQDIGEGALARYSTRLAMSVS